MIKMIQNVLRNYQNSFHLCRHRTTLNESTAILYCFILAVAYVASLYVLVPAKIRRLDRDDHRHIQYRCLSCVIMCIVAVGTYPMLFCEQAIIMSDEDSSLSSSEFSLETIMFRPRYLVDVLQHTMILYTGPIVASLLRVYEIQRRRQLVAAAAAAHAKSGGSGDKSGSSSPSDNANSNGSANSISSYPMEVIQQIWSPTIHSVLTPDSKDELWRNIRNFVVGPLTEEIIFRGCMVPVLLVATTSSTATTPSSSSFAVLKVSLIAPLFFGVAHIHHAVVRFSANRKLRLSSLVMVTAFQFVYTSLFGCYAAYAFIRTGSVLAVTVSHAYCNWMGLPDFNFVQIGHPMYRYRLVILASFLVGVFTFKHFLLCSDEASWLLLPLPSKLMEMLTLLPPTVAAGKVTTNS